MNELDLDDVTRRSTAAVQAWSPGCSLADLVPLEGGVIGLVFGATVDDGPPDHGHVVVKVAPPGLEPVRNRDVLRQARCMAALAGAPGVAVPEVWATDPGDPVDVPPLFVGEFIAGECKEPLLEAREAPMSPDVVRPRAFSAARMLAALHRVRPGDIGLDDEPVTTPTGEVDRWTHTLDTVPDPFRVGYEACARALRASAPPAVAPVVVHGDYRLGNMLCDGGEVTAIIDWEIWSISDPRIDLSWFLFFTEQANHPVVTPGLKSAMPTDAELLAAYEDSGGATTADLEWFHALTRYKEAAAMGLIAKHMQRRDPDGDGARAMAAVCPDLIADALRRVS